MMKTNQNWYHKANRSTGTYIINWMAIERNCTIMVNRQEGRLSVSAFLKTNSEIDDRENRLGGNARLRPSEVPMPRFLKVLYPIFYFHIDCPLSSLRVHTNFFQYESHYPHISKTINFS